MGRWTPARSASTARQDPLKFQQRVAFAETLASQLARPRGLAGQLLGAAMDLANRTPVRVALEMLAPHSEDRVLDVGCGTGEAIQQILDRAPCSITGIDPSGTMIRSARRKLGDRVTLVHSAVENATLPAAGFDAVLALNVLYFCGEDGAMLRAIRRVLAPGGRLVAYVSHRESMERWAFANSGLHRLYDERQLLDAIVDAGFAPELITVHKESFASGVTGIWAKAYS